MQKSSGVVVVLSPFSHEVLSVRVIESVLLSEGVSVKQEVDSTVLSGELDK